MKTKSIIGKIAVLTVVSFLLSYLAGTLSETNSHEFFPLAIAEKYAEKADLQLETFELTKKIELQDAKKIYVETISSNVVVEKANIEQLTLTLKGRYPAAKVVSGKLLQIDNSGGVLSITVDEKQDSSGKGLFQVNIGSEGKLTLLVPEKLKEAEIVSVSGDLNLKALEFDSLTLKTVSGNIAGDGLKAKKMQVNTVSGDVSHEGAVEDFRSKSISGDLKIKSALVTASMDLKTTSGDTEILFKSQPDAQVDFSSVSGSVKIAKALSNKSKVAKSENTEDEDGEDAKENHYQLGTGKGKIKASTVSGDLNVGLTE